MQLNIFNVDHGACALITTSNGRHMLIDCGHHAEKRWFPGTALNAMGVYALDKLFVTNFDEDHVSGFSDLMSKVLVDTLVKNGTVGPDILRSMKAEHGMGPGIRLLHQAMQQTFTGTPSTTIGFEDFGDTSFNIFRNPYNPFFGFTDSNNLSLVIFVRCGPHKIIFPGDLEKPGWKALLQDPEFVRELRDVNLFVASHHGRLNGYCPEVMALCPNIQAIIFSDEGIVYQTQETANLYRKHAKGFTYDGQLRRVLTTRSDKSMQFQLHETGGGTVSLNLAA